MSASCRSQGIYNDDHLVLRARHYWDKGEPLPLDLFAEMQAAGLDVVTLERKHMVIA